MILDESLSSREMRAVEMNSDYLGVSRLQLMENAGRAVADAIAGKFGTDNRVAIACGPGGNGGDGFVAARHLAGAGYQVEVLFLGRPENIASEEALVNWEALGNMVDSVKILEIRDSADIPPLEAEVVVDALIGTGVRGALSPPYSQMARAINDFRGFKIAVDVPTGLEADTGEAQGEAVRANLTLTFHKPKTGFVRAKKLLGDLVVCPIGIPPEAEMYAGPGDIYLASRPRPLESHKGDFGRVLVIGGSETYSGAPALTAMGAYAAGVDLVYVAAPETAASIVAGFSPSLITVKLKGTRLAPRNLATIESFLGKVEAVAVGPGLGLHEETIEASNAVLERTENIGLPVLLDADALKAFAGMKRRIRTKAVLTPHRGEFEILTGRAVEGSIVERGKAVAGFIAMGVSPFESAVAGAFINGAAGDAACDEKGYHLEPMDLVRKMPDVVDDALSGSMRRRDRRVDGSS
jgi:hydroxyethylthiazole kinase-like uncharacterized protein yjeF